MDPSNVEITHYVYPKCLEEREFPKWTAKDAMSLHKYHTEVGTFFLIFLIVQTHSLICDDIHVWT